MSNRLKTLLLSLVAVFTLPLLLFGVLFLATGGDYQVPGTVSADGSQPQVVLNGLGFHAETFGERKNPPLLVLHDGPGGDYHDLLALSRLARRYYVIFFDQRGSGLSARVPTSQLSIDAVLGDIEAFAGHYAPGRRISLLGHGWGGMLATAFAGRHPERVERLILAEPGFLNTAMANQVLPIMNQSSVGFLYQASVSWVRSLHIQGPDPDARPDFVFAHLRQHPAYHCGHKIPPRAEEFTRRAGFQAWKALTGSTLKPGGQVALDFTKGIEHYQRPVLILASSCNKLMGRSFQTRQARLFPKAGLVDIPASGHEMFLDNPEASVKAVEVFLASGAVNR
ncbi:MAG: alpha/beta fold hydrolase [Candidatus Sericytochromatia bacterium]